jgi:hypothetical protein
LKKVAAILALSFVLGGVAYASIPDSGGVIHGCYKTTGSNKELIVIDSPSQSCPMGYTALNWSQTGPQGATGAAGPAPDFDETEHPSYLHNFSGTIPAGPRQIDISAACEYGDVLVSAGYKISDPEPADYYLFESFPFGEYPADNNRWQFNFWHTGDDHSHTLLVTARCLDATPPYN